MDNRNVRLSLNMTCRLLGISTTAFGRWGLRPVSKKGREAFYDWPEALEMAFRKRAARPGAFKPPVVPSSLRDEADCIVARADEAAERGDLAALSAELAAMRTLVRAAGIDEDLG
jgi:hypothetical protein